MARFLLRYLGSMVMLTPGEFSLGRGPECGLQIDDPQVSRRHAILHVESDKITLEDLGSRNGIYLNNVRVDGRAPVRHGDVLRIGKQEVRVVEEEERLRRSALTTVQTDQDSDVLRMEIHGKPRDPAVAEAINKLSNRELEVLKLVALGYAQRDIGEELGVSVKTVETYRARINDKLGFKSRVELVRFALAAGMLEEESSGPR